MVSSPVESPPDVTAEPVVTDAPPTPEPVEETPPTEDGGTPETPEGSEQKADIPEGLDPDKTEAWLEAEAERRAEEKAQRKEAEAEKRARQRAKEADDGSAARSNLYDQAERGARASAAQLRQLVNDGEAVDTQTLDGHMNTIIAGVSAMAARDNETGISTLLTEALPDQTEDETEALEPLLYDFRRNGRFDKLLPKVLELATARKDAEIADLKRQLGNRKASQEAAKTLAKMAEQVGPGVGSETPRGKAASQQVTAEQFTAMTAAERRALRASDPTGYQAALRASLGVKEPTNVN